MTLALSEFKFDRLTDDRPFGKVSSPTAVFVHPTAAPIGLSVLENRGACFTYATGRIENLPGQGPALQQYWSKLFWFRSDLGINDAKKAAIEDPKSYAAQLMSKVIALATPVDLCVGGGSVRQLRARLGALADLHGDSVALYPAVEGGDPARFEIGDRVRTARPAYLKHLVDWHRPQWTRAVVDGQTGFLRHAAEPLRANPELKREEASAHEILERHRILQALYDTSGDFFPKPTKARGLESIAEFGEIAL